MAPDRANDNARDGSFDNLARMINRKRDRARLLFREELKHEIGKTIFQEKFCKFEAIPNLCMYASAGRKIEDIQLLL
jgi:hypothetical protein